MKYITNARKRKDLPATKVTKEIKKDTQIPIKEILELPEDTEIPVIGMGGGPGGPYFSGYVTVGELLNGESQIARAFMTPTYGYVGVRLGPYGSNYDEWNSLAKEYKGIKEVKCNSRRFRNSEYTFQLKDKDELKTVTDEFTDAQDAYEWLQDGGIGEFRVAYLNCGSGSVYLTYGYDKYSTGETAEKLYMQGLKGSPHYEILDEEEWSGRLGEMFDYINNVCRNNNSRKRNSDVFDIDSNAYYICEEGEGWDGIRMPFVFGPYKSRSEAMDDLLKYLPENKFRNSWGDSWSVKKGSDIKPSRIDVMKGPDSLDNVVSSYLMSYESSENSRNSRKRNSFTSDDVDSLCEGKLVTESNFPTLLRQITNKLGIECPRNLIRSASDPDNIMYEIKDDQEVSDELYNCIERLYDIYIADKSHLNSRRRNSRRIKNSRNSNEYSDYLRLAYLGEHYSYLIDDSKFASKLDDLCPVALLTEGYILSDEGSDKAYIAKIDEDGLVIDYSQISIDNLSDYLMNSIDSGDLLGFWTSYVVNNPSDEQKLTEYTGYEFRNNPELKSMSEEVLFRGEYRDVKFEDLDATFLPVWLLGQPKFPDGDTCVRNLKNVISPKFGPGRNSRRFSNSISLGFDIKLLNTVDSQMREIFKGYHIERIPVDRNKLNTFQPFLRMSAELSTIMSSSRIYLNLQVYFNSSGKILFMMNDQYGIDKIMEANMQNMLIKYLGESGVSGLYRADTAEAFDTIRKFIKYELGKYNSLLHELSEFSNPTNIAKTMKPLLDKMDGLVRRLGDKIIDDNNKQLI